MRARGTERRDEGRAADAQPARTTRAPDQSGAGGARLAQQGALALQRTVGNSAVVQMVQRSRHQHGAGCGHPRDEAPAVQRSGVHDVLRRPGTPLKEPVRQEMEGRLGADFGDVRLHTGSAARASATEIGARAYTSDVHRQRRG